MIFLKFLYAIFFLLYHTTGRIWGKGKPNDIKQAFDDKCLAYLKAIQNLNNNDLIKATHPVIIGLTVLGFLAIALASKIFGEKHLYVKEMVLFITPVAFVVATGFLTDEKIKLVIADGKEKLNKWVELVFKWAPRVIALVLTLSLVPEMMAGRQPEPEQMATMIDSAFQPVYIVMFIILLFIPITPYAVLAAPVLFVRVIVLRAIRWIVNKTLEDNSTKPFEIIAMAVTALFILDMVLIMKAAK